VSVDIGSTDSQSVSRSVGRSSYYYLSSILSAHPPPTPPHPVSCSLIVSPFFAIPTMSSPIPSSVEPFLILFCNPAVLFHKWNWLSVLTVSKAKGVEWDAWAYNGRTNLRQKKELVFYSSSSLNPWTVSHRAHWKRWKETTNGGGRKVDVTEACRPTGFTVMTL
jgi:hypothetical protein